MRSAPLINWNDAEEQNKRYMIEAAEYILEQYFSWAHFENTFRGEIHHGGHTFYMRVGLFLGRPVQAIICHGHIIRTRSAQHYVDEHRQLVKLDPFFPNNNLYYPAKASPGHYSLWEPKR